MEEPEVLNLYSQLTRMILHTKLHYYSIKLITPFPSRPKRRPKWPERNTNMNRWVKSKRVNKFFLPKASNRKIIFPYTNFKVWTIVKYFARPSRNKTQMNCFLSDTIHQTPTVDVTNDIKTSQPVGIEEALHLTSNCRTALKVPNILEFFWLLQNLGNLTIC